MRLTTYADYSLRLLIYLAAAEGRSATIYAVSQSYGISNNHLVKVAHQLGQKGFITTTRGSGGGLRLARPASEINVGDVVRMMEPDMAIVPCLQTGDTSCRIQPGCLLRGAMKEAGEAFLQVLDGYSIADLMGPRQALQELLQILPAGIEG